MNILVNSSGILKLGDKEFKCAIGKGGISTDKKEGDGATPAGILPIRKVFYRADSIPKPESPFETVALKPEDGWCDASEDPNYNKEVLMPYPASAENLWREDEVYDVIVVLGWNDNPPVPGKGSAIFMHVARSNYSPTAGCIALALPDLLVVLKNLSTDSMVVVE
jgi:L,D-peptidoglycan transpeptidase YkuD (ErfK/YbiS/YcfS/YnhG family)